MAMGRGKGPKIKSWAGHLGYQLYLWFIIVALQRYYLQRYYYYIVSDSS